jgi:hypothetical protein
MPVFVLVVQIEEPLDILHEVIEHNAIQTGYQILWPREMRFGDTTI